MADRSRPNSPAEIIANLVESDYLELSHQDKALLANQATVKFALLCRGSSTGGAKSDRVVDIVVELNRT